MKTTKQKTITIDNEENQTIEINVDERLIEFYKHETGHKRVTSRGLSKFISNLVKLFTY